MIPTLRKRSSRPALDFRFIAMALAALFQLTLSATKSSAVDSLAYSFESESDPTDGFMANGLGITLTQDTIGATEGTNSLKVSLVEGPTFVGALTQVLNPTPGTAIIGNPPGIDHVLFDMTIVTPYPTGEGKYANMGVTMFGICCGLSGGIPIQFADEETIAGKEAGTYHDLRIDLTSTVASPGVPAGKTFNQVFPPSPGANEFTPTGFQFFFNPDGGSAFDIYIDNIRVGSSPTAVLGDYNANGTVDAADYVVWRNGGPLAPGTEVADPGTVSPADYTEWKARFGNVAGSGNVASLAAAPEPAAAMLLLLAAMCGWGARRVK